MLARILDLIFPPRNDEEIVRELSLEKFLSLIEPRIVEKTAPETVALLPFADSRVRAVVHEAKYHGNERAFSYLAAALTDYLADYDALQKPILLPLPLGAKRLRERGFNQAEEVARRAARELGLSVETGLLTRTRETASQVSLAREARRENMRGAFGAAGSPSATASYILLDDVVTTGATLQAALDALASAGAQIVLPIALAH